MPQKQSDETTTHSAVSRADDAEKILHPMCREPMRPTNRPMCKRRKDQTIRKSRAHTIECSMRSRQHTVHNKYSASPLATCCSPAPTSSNRLTITFALSLLLRHKTNRVAYVCGWYTCVWLCAGGLHHSFRILQTMY